MDERTNVRQRALEKEEGEYAGQRGDKGALEAEERLPENAETVATDVGRGHDHGQHRG